MGFKKFWKEATTDVAKKKHLNLETHQSTAKKKIGHTIIVRGKRG